MSDGERLIAVMLLALAVYMALTGEIVPAFLRGLGVLQ